MRSTNEYQFTVTGLKKLLRAHVDEIIGEQVRVVANTCAGAP
jgi:hypothetical protein